MPRSILEGLSRDLSNITSRIDSDIDWDLADLFGSRLDLTKAASLISQLETEVDELCDRYDELVEEDNAEDDDQEEEG